MTIEPVKPIALDPETSAVIHAAQDALAREIRKAELVDDPVAPALLALGKMLDGLHQLFGATVAVYAVAKGPNLLRPMLTGRKQLPDQIPPPRVTSLVLAGIVFGGSATAVALLATFL